ncbi:uncharacterized protein LOC141696493 [Apium graveolens]|uniref:uncharacterized protein LOC141696493 n=1 Tax=Apium graveolens TaxID=4045 RepID=UPI003D7A85B8
MAAAGRFNFADMQNPLFLHPSDGPLSISVAKLQGVGDYRSWRRTFEIQISSKRKLGFLNGIVKRSTTDEAQGLQWDTCNNLLSNGSRKYKLNKELFSITQNKMKIHEYYTAVSSLWEELDSMNLLPTVTTVVDDVNVFLKAMLVQKEESRLFMFLNGLEDAYSAMRSQLLMQDPLPTVEAACAMPQQEESQRDVLSAVEIEHTAMYSRAPVEKNTLNCTTCGGKNHTNERCWSVTGYLRWHYKYKKPVPRGNQLQGQNRWNGNNKQPNQRQANNVTATQEVQKEEDVMFSAQQLQHLLKFMPGGSGNVHRGSDTEEELEMGFSGMVACNLSITSHNAWIIDSGASDHMTCSVEKLVNVKLANLNLTITLPTGDVSKITHVGDMRLKSGLILHNVLAKILKAVGRVYNGLYYLFDQTDEAPGCTQVGNESQCAAANAVDINLWHLRLGHASVTKMKHISMLQSHLPMNGQKSCINRPQQNARSERKHRHVLEVARSLKFQSGLPMQYWGEFVLTAAFGCLSFASNPDANIDKFSATGVPCVLLGYPPDNKGYRLLNLSTMQSFISRDIVFNEIVFPFNKSSSPSVSSYLKPLPLDMPSVTSSSIPTVDCDEFIQTDNIVDSNNEDSDDNSHCTSPDSSPSPISEPILRRSSRQTKPPAWLDQYSHSLSSNVAQVTDHLVHTKFNCFLASYTSNTDPTTFSQAIKHHHWIDAMNQELAALEMNNTWEVIDFPPSKKSIGCKWVFKTKFNADGTVERHKARLVIMGCKQTYGVDYMDTFAPVAKLTTVRTLLAVAAIQDWTVIQMDVTNAFLHSDLQEVVYMKFPPGYKGLGSRISYSSDANCSSSAQGLVCRLIKSLYGLRQAPRTWFSKLSLTLINNNYIQSKTDYSLFVRTTEKTIVLVLIYVDDFLITGNSPHDIAALKKMLFVNFHMKDLGNVRYFLGLEIDRTAEGFFVSQKKYTLDLLKEYNTEDVSPVKLPMENELFVFLSVKAELSFLLFLCIHPLSLQSR